MYRSVSSLKLTQDLLMRYNNNIQDCYPVPSVQLELEILILTLRLPVLRYLGVYVIILYGVSMPSLLIYIIIIL